MGLSTYLAPSTSDNYDVAVLFLAKFICKTPSKYFYLFHSLQFPMKTNFLRLLMSAFSLCLLCFNAVADPNSIKVRSYTVNNIKPGDKDLSGNLINIPIDASGASLSVHLILERATPFYNSNSQIQTDEAYYAFYVATLASPPALYALPPSRIAADGTSYTSRSTMTGNWQTEFGNPSVQLLDLPILVALPGNPNGVSPMPYLYAVAIDPGSGFSTSSVISRSAGMGLNYIVAGNPFIASVDPINPSVYSYITVIGSSFTNTDYVAFYDATTSGPPITRLYRGSDLVLVSSTELRVRIPIGTIPANTASMPRSMMVFTTANGYVRSSNLITFNITAAISPANPPALVSVGLSNFASSVGRMAIYSSSNVQFELYSGLSLTVNGVPAVITGFEYFNFGGGQVFFTMPSSISAPYGPYTGPVVLHTSVGDSNPVYFPIACQPCANNNAVCGGSNVRWGDVPRTLLGRDLADNGTGSCFASSDEHEWAQWQYSNSNNWDDWHDINNATNRHFPPGACVQTTYYRRKSTHINYDGINHREEWYLSNSDVIIPYMTINEGVYQIRNRYTGQILEIGGGATATYTNGTYANQWPYVGTANQEWVISLVSDGMYKIINRNSGQALEIGGGNDPQPTGSLANQWPYWGGKKQLWLFLRSTRGYYTISSANSGQVLEIPGGSTQQGTRAGQYTPNTGAPWAQWELVPVNVPSSSRFPGVYTIENLNSHQVLEVGGAATNNGATTNQYPYVGLASQQWTIVDAGNGLFNVINRNSGLALEIGGSDVTPGAIAQQWTKNTGTNQQWRIEEISQGSGTYTFTNVNSNQRLTIGSYSTTTDAGATANQWPDYAGINQKWILNLVSQNRTSAPVKVSASQQSKSANAPNASTSRKLEESPTILLYPNPASTVLNLVPSNGTDITSVKVMDLRGALVSQASYQGNGHVDISALAAGVYFVTASDGQHEYHTKFIKQ